jgi:hypothetical protein
MKASTRKLMDNTTAFRVIEMGDIEIRQYWTSSVGLYGYQVVTVIFDGNGTPDMRTTGCGYDKPSAGLEWALYLTGNRPVGMQENGDVPRCYYIGGNFYRVPVDMCKAIQ